MIKRPVRKGDGAGFQPDIQVHRPSGIVNDFNEQEEEETKGGFMNECNFNISPSRVPASQQRP